jgi:hypothetical protein
MAEPVGLKTIMAILRVTRLEVTAFDECHKLTQPNFTVHVFVFVSVTHHLPECDCAFY